MGELDPLHLSLQSHTTTAASVPCGFTLAGLPAGLQVVGRMFDDRTVLKVCAAYEAETKFYKARPKGY